MRSSKSSAASAVLEDVIETTFHLSRAMRHALQSGFKDQRINMLQFHAMLYLKEHEGMTMSELARQMHVTSPTATSFINRLVRQKWVQRRHDPLNRKLVRLKLTAQGAGVIKEKMMEHKRIISTIFVLLTAAEQRQLLALHKKLLSRLAHKRKA